MNRYPAITAAEYAWYADMCRMRGLFLPIRTTSEANAHEHWRVRQKRAKAQRQAAMIGVLTAWHRLALTLPAIVTMTRYGRRELDSDNLAGSFKHIRDGIADAFGVDDRDQRYTWVVRQERSKHYGIRIEIDTDRPF